MRLVALACAIALTLGSTSAPAEHPVIAQLAEELSARSGPGFWGSTAGPLVRDDLLMLSEQAAREHARWAGDFLKRVEAVPTAGLEHKDWISWSLLRWEAEMAAGRGAFYWQEVPIAPYSSPLRTITSGFASAQLQSAADRHRYLDGLHQLPVLTAQLESKLRGQVVRGIVLPAAQVEAIVPFVRTFAVPAERNPFALSQARLDSVPSDARATFTDSVRATIDDTVVPAFRRLAEYLDGPYRARAGDEVGVGRYPDGQRYYAYLVRQHTGLDLTPQEIHDIGLKEVARLESELEAARQQARFTGTMAEFRTFLKTDKRFFPTTAEQVGDRLLAAAARIEPKLAEWFLDRPRASYGARRLAPALEPVMTYGFYQIPTPQDGRGYYMFNGSRLEERSLLNVAALSYHELVPGHHFQLALVLENTSLSKFRRAAAYTAYLEGWGEYASDLAGEMGMYADPYDRAGRLAMDLFLTTRLVVDTGMNALGWSRARGMAYMREHTFESETQIASESLRYSTDLPAQALAYKLGSLGIRGLRERMRTKLGDRFDVRQFHQAVLGHGSMPIAILEQHVERRLLGR